MNQTSICKKISNFGKTWYRPLAVLGVLLLVILLWPSAARAAGDVVVAAVGTIVGGLAQLIIYAIGGLVLVVLSVLKEVAGYNVFINSQAVIIGWVVVRDLANMFFILILLMIAFATILRIESYNYKRLLPKLLLLVILVNFSRTICGVAIDFSQVVMLTFYNGFKDTGPGNFINVTRLPKWLDFVKGADYLQNQAEPPTVTGVIGSYFAAVIYAAIMLVVLVIIVVVFAFRIIMLWLLTILSPMFFLLMSFPAGQSYAKQWSSQFAKYLVVGPVLTFFVWLSLAVFGTIDASTDFANTSADQSPAATATATAQPGVGPSEAGTTGQMFRFIIAIGLLVGGLTMTSQLGVAGGKMAGAALSKIQSIGTKAAMLPFRPIGYAAKGLTDAAGNRIYRGMLNNKATRVLTPDFWKGVGALGKERLQSSKDTATAHGREAYETVIQTMKGGGAEGVTPWVEMSERQTEQAHIAKFKKEMGGGAVTPEKISELMLRMHNRKGEDADEMRRAVMQLAGQEGYIDDAVGQFVKTGVINKDNAAEWGMNVNDQGEVQVDNDAYRTFAAHYLGMNVSGEKGQGGIDAGTIANRMWKEAGIEGINNTQEALEAMEDPNDDRVKKEDWNRITKASRAERDANMAGIKGSKKSDMQNALRALIDVGESGKTIGHWENMMAQQGQDGNYYLMDSDESFDRVSAEANKMDQQKFWQQLASHPTVAFTAKLGDADGSGADFDRDNTGYQNRFMRRFSRELMNETRISEKHRGQPRANHDRIRSTLRYDEDRAWVAASDIKNDDGTVKHHKGDFLNPEAYARFQGMMKTGTPAEIQAAYRLAMFSKQDKGVAPDLGESFESFQSRLETHRAKESQAAAGISAADKNKPLTSADLAGKSQAEKNEAIDQEIRRQSGREENAVNVASQNISIDQVTVDAHVSQAAENYAADLTEDIKSNFEKLESTQKDVAEKSLKALENDLKKFMEKLPETTRQQLQMEMNQIAGDERQRAEGLKQYILKNFKYFSKK